MARVLLVFCLVLLTSCDQPPPIVSKIRPIEPQIGIVEPSPIPNKAAAIHARWIEAMQENDRDGALLLVEEHMPERTAFVDASLQLADGEWRSTNFGPFVHVDNLGVIQHDTTVGTSAWVHTNGITCYQTILRQVDDQWRVVGWEKLPQCRDQPSVPTVTTQ